MWMQRTLLCTQIILDDTCVRMSIIGKTNSFINTVMYCITKHCDKTVICNGPLQTYAIEETMNGIRHGQYVDD